MQSKKVPNEPLRHFVPHIASLMRRSGRQVDPPEGPHKGVYFAWASRNPNRSPLPFPFRRTRRRNWPV